MKIKVTDKNYEAVCGLAFLEYKRPVKQSAFWRKLIKFLSAAEMRAIDFSYTQKGMEHLNKDEPCLILMNHSSFTDLQIAGTIFADRQYHIICTNDGFVGKFGLMRRIGCIPTRKFITDATLVKSMKYAFEELRSSCLMFPEASYSFDGTQTPLPESLAKFIKIMKVPVVMVRTHGAYLRDPLYNNLQKRNVKVSAEVSYLLSPEDIAAKSTFELKQVLDGAFEYDHFKEQFEQGVEIKENFRADGLHRPLYKCPHCMTEGSMLGKGTRIRCGQCSVEYELSEKGKLICVSGEKGIFEYVSDWYKWEREKVREEIQNGSYKMREEVDILMLKDMKSMYRVGKGILTHDIDGFVLKGCDGKLSYKQSGKSSYSLYSDYFWYEIGDMISIGDNLAQYYCFPVNQEKAIVAKARLATEEIYKTLREKHQTA